VIGLTRSTSSLDGDIVKLWVILGTIAVLAMIGATLLAFGLARWVSRPLAGLDTVPAQTAYGLVWACLAEPYLPMPSILDEGAAALDSSHPCSNPALRRVVTPTPRDAVLLPGWPCSRLPSSGIIFPCAFGVSVGRALGTVALVGDSHAEHWRAALEVVAQAKRWRAVSITRAGCPVTTAPISRGIPVETAKCTLFNGELMRWLKRHPEVHTVFVSSNQIAPFVTDAIAGYRAAWRALPRTIRRIYVLRDTPRQFDPDTPTCVERLLRVQSEIGAGCAETRQRDLPVDPEAQAARGPSVDARVRLLDFTRFMCTATLCPPVVGGVLVLKDGGHLTRTFSTTLGPYVLKATG